MREDGWQRILSDHVKSTRFSARASFRPYYRNGPRISAARERRGSPRGRPLHSSRQSTSQSSDSMPSSTFIGFLTLLSAVAAKKKVVEPFSTYDKKAGESDWWRK